MNNMVNILNEVYVSEETLKLLKEAGFNWDCRKIQVRLGVFVSRPTLAVAQKWIREVCGADICVHIFRNNSYRPVIYKYDKDGGGKDYTDYENIWFNTYEDALAYGITRYLNILLKNKK
jgi:hypothetical protein